MGLTGESWVPENSSSSVSRRIPVQTVCSFVCNAVTVQGESFCCNIRLWGTYLHVSHFLTSVHTTISLLVQVCISIIMFPSRLPFPAHLCVCLRALQRCRGGGCVFQCLQSTLTVTACSAAPNCCPCTHLCYHIHSLGAVHRQQMSQARKHLWRQSLLLLIVTKGKFLMVNSLLLIRNCCYLCVNSEAVFNVGKLTKEFSSPWKPQAGPVKLQKGSICWNSFHRLKHNASS